ncbi:MAG: alpha/beta hydrolase [Candidatus Magasanikbacteria bacterium]|nr:alpha/beta hydrolase [Candidatus Magasanikbacteria bacterium]
MTDFNNIRSEQIVIDGLLTSFIASNKTSTKPPILFLHGWGSSKEVWNLAMQTLESKGVVSYALDLPGFGKTEKPREVWNVHTYVAFILEFLRKLDIKKVIVVGHSFGGRLALVLAAENPALVSKLVLVDSAGVRTKPGFKKFLASVSKLARPLFRLRWTNPLRKKIYRLIDAEDYVATPELNKTFVQVIGEDLQSYAPRILQPTLIVWGKNDMVTPIFFATEFKNKIPRSRLVVLSGAGHYSFLDQPAEFIEALQKFLN